MTLLISWLYEPENELLDTWPPYDTKLAVVGENAIQLITARSINVILPIVTLMVTLVPWRLVGAADICKAALLESILKPFKNTLMTGCWSPLNALDKLP